MSASVRKHVAEARATLLVSAGEVLANSLDYATTLQAVATLAVSGFADACLVDILREDGTAERLAVDHRDPALREAMQEFKAYAIRVEPDTQAAGILETGRAKLFPVWDAASSEGIAHDAGHLALVQSMHPHSLIMAPLVAREKILGMLLLASDTPERIFDEEDLRLAEELARRAALAVDNARLYTEARNAIAARDHLLSMVSHDLRNPLSVVMMATALLRAQVPAESTQMRRQLEMIARSADQMTRMIGDLLEVARADAGQLSMVFLPVSAAELVAEGAELLEPLARDRGITLLVELGGEMPAVHADRSRILQVFSNLGGNAVKFTPQGGTITLRAVVDGDSVCFQVKDTGEGIRGGDLAHLFDRFWQASRTDRRGIGLGLAIVQGIVLQHGGRVWAESTPGQGSTFYFTLPIASA